MPIVLTEPDVRALLPMRDLIDTMERALIDYSSGRVQQPLRTVLVVGEQKAFFGVMPAYLPEAPALGTKLVTVFGSNPAAGLPTHLATVILLDPSTGALVALLDGRYITEARTAAVSAVSVRHLAREDAGTLAIIGSGVQARSHLEALACVRPLVHVRVWSRDAGRRAAFVRDMQPHTTAPISEAASAHDAVKGADLIVLATASREPVVQDAWVPPGAHICAVGACRPDQREMDAALVARGRVFVDSRTGALAEAGDIVMAIDEGAIRAEHIAGELGDAAAGRVAGRLGDDQLTIFKSLGMAVEDVAAAHLAWTRAKGRGSGTEVAL